MGTTEAVLEEIRAELAEQGRNYSWLARAAGVPYKRLLAEIKHGSSKATLEVVCAASNALGIDIGAVLDAVAAERVAA